jgi:hypothetical protein
VTLVADTFLPGNRRRFRHFATFFPSRSVTARERSAGSSKRPHPRICLENGHAGTLTREEPADQRESARCSWLSFCPGANRSEPRPHSTAGMPYALEDWAHGPRKTG